MPLIGKEKVKAAIDKTVINLNTKLSKEYFKALRVIVTETPFDKGRARGNWFLSVGSVSNKVTESTSPSDDYKNIPSHVLGKTIYFTNNLPYINKLEYGGYGADTEKVSNHFSRLAPGGWVRKELRRLAKRIKQI